jgi:hypothetical protein
VLFVYFYGSPDYISGSPDSLHFRFVVSLAFGGANHGLRIEAQLWWVTINMAAFNCVRPIIFTAI